LRRGFPVVLLVLACFALSSTAQAQLPSPTPDGGYPGNNTAEGDGALSSVQINLSTGDGTSNTANGFNALKSNTTGGANTANGAGALQSNTTGGFNTAIGAGALPNNTTGNSNTATGVNVLVSNTTGIGNTANGVAALLSNTTGIGNTANGLDALQSNTTGSDNTAIGFNALFHNTTGHNNTANGDSALFNNTTGNNNIALGFKAGQNLTMGNNIDIGNRGLAGEANKIRIGAVGTQTATFIAGIHGATVAGGVGVIIDSTGHLGTVVSSERFKEAIKPMDKASEAILALKPVTFRYKHELDPDGIPQFGLVAEQVEKVNPDLVGRDEQGKPYTVRYEAVSAMLLNEFLKEHRKVEEQQATIGELKSAVAEHEKLKTTIAQQQKQIEALTATVQKVSDQVALSKPAPQLVANP